MSRYVEAPSGRPVQKSVEERFRQREERRNRRERGREEGEPKFPPCNIMSDPRVCRGTVFTNPIDHEEIGRKSTKRVSSKPSVLKRYVPVSELHEQTHVVQKHVPFPMELYLEEQIETDQAIQTKHQTTQIDALLEAGPPPVYIPPKIGLNASTQIEQGELYDFDVQVEPLLQVLVGKLLEQSLMEVREEEEMASIRERTNTQLEMKEQETLRLVRYEAELRQRQRDKQQMLNAKEKEQKDRTRMLRKFLASSLATNYLSTQFGSRVIEALNSRRIFYDPTEMNIDLHFIPSLCTSIESHIERYALSHQLATELINQSVVKYLEQLTSRQTEYENVLRQRHEQKQLSKKVLRLYIKCAEIDADKRLGPLVIQRGQSLSFLLTQLKSFVALNYPDVDIENATFQVGYKDQSLSPSTNFLTLPIASNDTLQLEMSLPSTE